MNKKTKILSWALYICLGLCALMILFKLDIVFIRAIAFYRMRHVVDSLLGGGNLRRLCQEYIVPFALIATLAANVRNNKGKIFKIVYCVIGAAYGVLAAVLVVNIYFQGNLWFSVKSITAIFPYIMSIGFILYSLIRPEFKSIYCFAYVGYYLVETVRIIIDEIGIFWVRLGFSLGGYEEKIMPQNQISQVTTPDGQTINILTVQATSSRMPIIDVTISFLMIICFALAGVTAIVMLKKKNKDIAENKELQDDLKETDDVKFTGNLGKIGLAYIFICFVIQAIDIVLSYYIFSDVGLFLFEVLTVIAFLAIPYFICSAVSGVVSLKKSEDKNESSKDIIIGAAGFIVILVVECFLYFVMKNIA